MPRPRSEESSNDDEFDQLGVRRCERLPAGFPDEWRDLQLSVGVGLILTNGTALTARSSTSSQSPALQGRSLCSPKTMRPF